MIKYFIALTFILVGFNLKAQDTSMVNIPFQMYDNGGGHKTLYLGVDSTATDSIDLNLGESDLPPFPPAGVFEARWILPAGGFSGELSSYTDYRYEPSVIFADTVEYRLKYQGAEGADTMFFGWNFPVGITALLQDIVIGTIVNVPMSGTGVFGLANFGALNQMKLLVYYNFTPVEMTSFTANVIGNGVVLNWATATEENNRGFSVERNGISLNRGWETIGFVQGNGTTTEPKVYSFTDNNVSSGNYSYRLKQIDFNGKFKYSPEIEVNISHPENFSLSQNYPNPFNPATTIKFNLTKNSMVTLKVFNMIGQDVATLVNRDLAAGEHSINFNASQLTSGIYFYRININGNEFTAVKKMTLLK